MNELDKLRPEVRDAFRRMDRDVPRGHETADEWPLVRAELLRLAEELAALKARIADAPELRVERHPGGAVTVLIPESFSGKRVRLFVEE